MDGEIKPGRLGTQQVCLGFRGKNTSCPRRRVIFLQKEFPCFSVVSCCRDESNLCSLLFVPQRVRKVLLMIIDMAYWYLKRQGNRGRTWRDYSVCNRGDTVYRGNRTDRCWANRQCRQVCRCHAATDEQKSTQWDSETEVFACIWNYSTPSSPPLLHLYLFTFFFSL